MCNLELRWVIKCLGVGSRYFSLDSIDTDIVILVGVVAQRMFNDINF